MTKTLPVRMFAVAAALALAMGLVFAIGTLPAQAKDAPDYFGKSKVLKVGKTYTQKFEKKKDSDTFNFNLKPGKKYAVAVYDLSGRTDEQRDYGGIETMYTTVYKKNGWGAGADHGTMALGDASYMFKIGKGHRDKYTALMFTGDYKGKYKFRVYQLSSKKRTIKYVMNGDENASENPAKFTNKTQFIKLEDPYRYDATFMGWYTKATGGKQVKVIDTSVNKNVTLYARWQVETE